MKKKINKVDSLFITKTNKFIKNLEKELVSKQKKIEEIKGLLALFKKEASS